jgi:hypothetical protein
MATDSIAISKNVEARSFWQGAVVVLGRFLFALIFLMAGANHFNKQTIGYAASQDVPLAAIAVPLSGVLAVATDKCFGSKSKRLAQELYGHGFRKPRGVGRRFAK